MRNNRVIVLAAIVGIAIVAITYLGASRLSGDEKGNTRDQKTLSPVKNGSRGVVVFGTGDIDNGIGLLPVFPDGFPQPCKVKKVHVVEGQRVELDQVLIDFDTELADMKVLEARAGLAKAKAIQQGAEAVLAQSIKNEKIEELAVAAQSSLLKSKETDLEGARIDLNEKKRRARAVDIMDPELLAAEKKLESAQHALESEKKKLEALKIGNLLNPFSISKSRAEAGVEEAKNAIAIQEAQLQQALYGKKLMQLRAPAAGRIVRTSVTEGMSFGAQTRHPALMIQTDDPLIIRAEVDQEFASRVVKGQDAIVTDDGNPNLRWNGKVVRVSDSFLPKRGNMSPEGLMLNDVRVLECIISIDSGTGNSPVRVGQRVKVSIGVE